MDAVDAFAGKAEGRMLPSGIVSFLFTDIVGSTALWERDRDAMQRDVRRHDELLRASIEAAQGVVFKTVGDAFCAAFASVDNAIAAALAAQRALCAEPFQSEGGIHVRMALHVGDADERDADYFGPTLNRVARLLAIGHGGQILLSRAAAQSVGVAPAGTSLRDLGEHLLKDLTVPEPVFQLVVPDLVSEFPELRSLSVLANNLPQQVTSLIGRERTITEIMALLATSRLVTLCGAGGVGKTRCALQIGADLLDDYKDGVWFADLAPLVDASLVPSTVARLFDLQESPHRAMLEVLAGHLKHKELLLILDNCEHVIGEAAKSAAALLRGCPRVKIVTTSREGLSVAGEAVYRMPSLAVPSASKHLTAEAARVYGAVALLEARGHAGNPRFAVTDENAAVVADVCRRLDGIPLAIELAAARLNVLSPSQLVQKLDERFRILTGGDRTALPRQQTMRALIDWSYDFLTAREQALFRYVSIFAGGFTLEAATAIGAHEAIEAFDVLDTLTSLVEKSLVFAEPSGDAMRYGMLESTRQYAREKLQECGEYARVSRYHAQAFTEIAEHVENDYENVSHQVWLAEAEPELENLRAALRWSFSPEGDVSLGQRIAVTVPRLFGILAAADGRRWVKVARENVTAETPPKVVAGLDLAEAVFASSFNQFRAALASSERALAIFSEANEEREVVDAQRIAGRSLVYLGRVEEGERLLQEALASRLARGSPHVGGTLRDLAVARALGGDIAGSRILFEQAAVSFEAGADESNSAITAATLAEVEFLGGDIDAALKLAQKAFDAVRALGRGRTAAAILGNIAAYEIVLKRLEDARRHSCEALELARDSQADVSVAFALQHLAAVSAHNKGAGAQRAARLIGFVENRLASLEIAREHTERQEYDTLVAVLEADLGASEFGRCMEEGKGWTEEHALSEARSV
ncbi:MAG TPA: adenylate/guanylate cyclase domain-containing protein [Candidatus Baltobacteraceae bacterium]|nr:adenylate/guanylate cyclase domain-containing protein [Candidatus Baltobacteraceae bacterium]